MPGRYVWLKAANVTCAALGVIVAMLSLGAVFGQQLTSCGSTRLELPGPSPTPAPGYRCQMPYTALPYARTWIQLGDSFAAGAGATVPAESSWIALLGALARVRLGSRPTIINAVGSAPDSLPEQIRLLRAQPVWQELLAARERVLLFVSYGAEWLQARAELGGQDAALSTVIEHLALLVGSSNASLIPPDAADQFGVVLITHPDPTAGGVFVPAEYAQCSGARTLNWPTLASRAAHDQIYARSGALYTHLQALATRNGWAFVDTDAALGAYAWPSARAADGCAWRDCRSYNDRGHSLLAALLWACLQRDVY
jgi:hypothetical protein